MFISPACVLSITDYTAQIPLRLLKILKVKCWKSFSRKRKKMCWMKQRREMWGRDQKKEEDAFSQVIVWPPYKCWTCSQIYKDFLGTCVWTPASSMGKLSKVMTISLLLLFFFLCLNSTTSGLVTALCNWYREDMLSELQPQHCIHFWICPSCPSVSHSSAQLRCRHLLDRKPWSEAKLNIY